MTTAELKEKLNREFGIHRSWPTEYVVDHETYANVCQDIFSRHTNTLNLPQFVRVAVGPRGGIMFASMELILKG